MSDRIHFGVPPDAQQARAADRDHIAAQRLAAIVESSDDAIIGKDLRGVITSWNKGAERIFGYTAAEIIGEPVMRLIPPEYQDEEPVILERLRRGEHVDHYETVRKRKDGGLVEVSLSVSPIRNADGMVVGAAKIARDIGERREMERKLRSQSRRFERLDRLSRVIAQDLDLERTVQTVTDIATELSGAKFGAFFYNVAGPEGESYMLYTLSGAPREAFEKFGMPRNTAVFGPTFHGAIMRSDDIRADPRYGKNAPHHGMPAGHLPVVSYLAVPVIGRGDNVLGGLFFGHDLPGMFTVESEEMVKGIAAHAAIAIDNARLLKAAQDEIEQRRRAEESKELLLHEIQHRVKNTLVTVQAIAAQTFRGAPAEQAQAFSARILALANAHDLLNSNGWDRVAVGDTVDRALAPFLEATNAQLHLDGPGLELPANKALLLAMILHELGTNAVKYGALSRREGRVDFIWRVDGDSGERLVMSWRETGGPPVQPPGRKGFGSAMIERVLQGERGNARTSYAPSGFSCEMEMPL